MAHGAVKDPCRIVDSDSEDENERRLQARSQVTTRPSTSQSIRRVVSPKTLDWTVESDLTRPTERKRSNKKPAPVDEAAAVDSKSPSRLHSDGISSSSSDSSLKFDNRDQPVVTTPTSPSGADFPYAALFGTIADDLNKFTLTHLPQDYPGLIQCRLRRDTSGVQGRFFPTFYLHAERPGDGRKIFLLAARKVGRANRQAEYTITTSIEELSAKSGGDGYVGKLRGLNLAGTEYTLYDDGRSPNKSKSKKHQSAADRLRRELIAIIYESNILGFKGPRQMSMVIPSIGHDLRPTADEPGLLEKWHDRRFTRLISLRNKAPVYDEAKKTYVIQFVTNRVIKPSVKNFQIVLDNSESEEVVMQFGRVDDDTFTCDYRYPLSAIQAFAIALSSFDSSITRE